MADNGVEDRNGERRNGDPVKTPEGSTTSSKWIGPDGHTVPHAVEAGWMALRDDKDAPVADIFSVSYIAGDSGTERPVTFVFNGGPGASSAFLHLGALGPRRVMFDEGGQPLPPPTVLMDNAESWLRFTDLVFVDPVGTGWSRIVDAKDRPSSSDGGGTSDTPGASSPARTDDPKQFFAVNKDLDSLTEFISRWLSAHARWSSPLFVAGESYGGFRAAKLARLCHERGMGLNGVILISPALEFALLDTSDYDVLPWVDLVPTMALAAHHHGRCRAVTSSSTEAVRTEAESFATGPYATALIRGASMASTERADVMQQLADLIGLPVDLVTRHEGRISMTTFARNLLRDQGLVVGLYDASVTGRDPFPDRDVMEGPDPTLAGIDRVFTAGINARLRSELGVETDRQYHLLSMDVHRDWKIDLERNALESQIGATDDLRYGMAVNPHMKVFLTHGRFDLVTPYFASDRIRNLLRLDETGRAALTVEHFDGGHMFYAWNESRIAFREAIARFYAGAITHTA